MRKLRMGMIGGGFGSFIGDVHRKASGLDGMIDLVCGAFSSTTAKSKAFGKDLLLSEDRCYGSFEEMILKEKELPDHIRMDFVSIVTPNYMHFAPAKLALEHGFHVVCDKPMTLTIEEAKVLENLVKSTGLLFALTHNYPGSPMVKQAKYVTGLKVTELAADLGKFVDGRQLDDDGNILLRLENGAKGILSISQIAVGEENNFSIRVYGEKGSLEWHQETPNELITRWIDQPKMTFTPNGNGIYPLSLAASRIPAGHPEGFIEAFANVYKNFATQKLKQSRVISNNH